MTLIIDIGKSNYLCVHFTSRIEAGDAALLGLPMRKSCIVPNGVDMPDPTSGSVPPAADEPARPD